MPASPRNVVVFGASGRAGSRLVEYALDAGHRVMAVARHQDALGTLSHLAAPGRLRLHAADAHDASAVAEAVRGADVVLSALAAPSLERPGDTLSRGMRNIVAGLEASSPAARVLCIAGAGILPDASGALMLDSPAFPDVYRAMSREHAAAWRALRESDLSWVVVCPPDMPSGERTRHYRTEAERMPANGTLISAEDVADFMVREGTERRYHHVRVGIAY